MKSKNDILIKVLSLGVGLAVGIVLIAKVFFELSYDSFYKDIDRVYTINTWYSMQGEEKDYGQVSGAVAVGFMDEVPGVEAGTRTTYVFNGDTYLDEDGNKLAHLLLLPTSVCNNRSALCHSVTNCISESYRVKEGVCIFIESRTANNNLFKLSAK